MVVKKEGKKETKKKLTIKQAKFTKEYLKTGNATQSAKNAGYSKKTAYSIGNENLKKPEIRKEIQSAAEKLGITAEYVLGNLKEIADFNKEKRIKARSIGNDIFQEEEMIDVQASIKANDLLGKHLKLFTDQIDIKAEVKTEDQELTDAVRQLLFLATQ
jgi:phage terminase small subunit